MARLRMALALASLVFGLLLYVLSVAGAFTADPVPPADVGLTTTTAVFVLLGLAGVWLDRTTSTA